MLAVCLKAGLDGILNKVEPPQSVDCNIYKMTETQRRALGIRQLPANLLEALEDAKGVKNVLTRNGFTVNGVCTSGAQAVSQADGLNDGILICSYKLADMVYAQIREYLPSGFEMLLIASAHLLSQCQEEALIREAKEVLMGRNHMGEREAHRYLQKCSMDSGTNPVETAQMVLSMMKT